MASAERALRLADCINDVCPWSGDPVSKDALSTYRGEVVGFCNPGCRDKFEKAISLFETKLKRAKAQG
ncbi:MAG: glutathione S-transferase [Robiginitomaculum sp.]|nr:glutathione S-transferase [Robiginitomaculum sp.]MDQ7077675.1 glutathione S-transferase [Robiginitomaculum sp.]